MLWGLPPPRRIVYCGNSDSPLGLPLDALDWRGPGLVPVSPLGEDQFLVAQGGWSLQYQ